MLVSVRRVAIHHPIHIGNLSVTFLKSRHETHGHADIFEITVPAHVHLNVPHLHRGCDETIIGMDGITTWTLDGEEIQVGPGQQLHIPRGVAHTYVNTYQTTARMLCILTPGTIGPEYFRELAAAVDHAGRADISAVGTVMARYGIIPAKA
jgi:mannose-6-phosphate isomerase-like protein (cupin superfamily)